MKRANLLLEYRDNIAILTVNRPQVLNALNSETLYELSHLLDELKDNSKINVIILTGAGDRAFIAGADLSELRDLNPIDARRFAKLGHETYRKLELLPQPVIAAINGFALGGGAELALACDIRIASENAKFGQPEVKLGFTAGWGGTQRLPRIIGAGRASELLLTGEMIDAAEAFRIGLVNHVYQFENLMNEALALAGKIARCAPIAVQQSKTAIYSGLNMDLHSALKFEAEVFALTFSTNDQKEGCRAFLEKRKPIFLGQ